MAVGRLTGKRRHCSPRGVGVLCILGALSIACYSRAFLGYSASRSPSAPGIGARVAKDDARAHRVRLAAAKGFDPIADPKNLVQAVEDPTAVLPIHGELTVEAMGYGPGSFMMTMGGTRILVNPVLDGVKDPAMAPEKVHELVDYVVITSAEEEYLHVPTLQRMNLMKVNFVADQKAGEVLERLMVRNLAILGPMGRGLLDTETDAAPVGVLIAPGTDGPTPWSPPESAFLFVNMKSGVCVAYDAKGSFLGKNAGSTMKEIPEEAYQADYLVTPSLVAAQGICKGLASKGAQLRGVVSLPTVKMKRDQSGGGGMMGLIDGLDDKLDAVLGGALSPKMKGETGPEFTEFLRTEGGGLAETKVYEPAHKGGVVELEKALE